MKNVFVVRATITVLATLTTTFALGQVPDAGRTRGVGGPGGGFFGGGGSLALISRDDVQQELQLVDEQREKVRAIAEEARNKMRDDMRESFGQLRDLNDDDRRAQFDKIRARMDAINKDVDAKLQQVLLPHQLERLKQIDVQTRVQQRGASALTSGDLADTLKLTDEQRQKLEQRSQEVQQELRDKTRQLQIEAHNKLLDVLTPEQRAKLQTLMGEQFEPQDNASNFGRGGFRGRTRGRGNGGARTRAGGESI